MHFTYFKSHVHKENTFRGVRQEASGAYHWYEAE